MPESPNIAVFVLDTARADHLSCYGYSRQTTPFLDEVASYGVIYTNAYSNATWSLPAYASFFTGKYPSEHGVVDWQRSVESNRLVEGLNERGYETLGFSPHILPGDYGLAEPFDTAELVPKPNDRPYSHDPAFARLQDRSYTGSFAPVSRYLDALRFIITESSPQTFANKAHALSRKLRTQMGWWRDSGAKNVLNRSRESIDRATEPFFLFTNFMEPHFPYRPPKDYIYEYVDEEYSIRELNEHLQQDLMATTLGQQSISDESREVLIDMYDASIRYLDDQLRQFIST
jgi:arylsulfatase A-like enzyme